MVCSFLSDTDPGILNQAAGEFHVANTGSDYSESLELFDAAVLAVPNHLHYPIAADLLKAGKHVLVEKPLALQPGEGQHLSELSMEHNAVLTVGLVKRFYSTTSWLKTLLNDLPLGALTGFEIEEGYVFDWPLLSDSLTNPDKSGGGVLMDIGIHWLDLLNYWFEDFTIEYSDDYHGGVEAECLLEITLSNGVKGSMLLSRLRSLHNSAIFRFENGAVNISVKPGVAVHVESETNLTIPEPHTVDTAFSSQIENFQDRIERNDYGPDGTVTNSIRSLHQINECYESRGSLDEIRIHF